MCLSLGHLPRLPRWCFVSFCISPSSGLAKAAILLSRRVRGGLRLQTGERKRLARIHIIEDDAEISSLLCSYLEKRGHDCVHSASSEEAQQRDPADSDLFIVDIMLPGQDGLSFCSWLRERSQVPLIILSAEKGHTKRIHGIELGADDYLEKPFSPRELLARINALLRRSGQGDAPAPRRLPHRAGFDGWVLDSVGQKLHAPGDMHVPLSSTEYQLLVALMTVSPEPVGREEIGRTIFRLELGPEDRRVDILISRLRKKMTSNDAEADFIRTVRNRGYQFCGNIRELD